MEETNILEKNGGFETVWLRCFILMIAETCDIGISYDLYYIFLDIRPAKVLEKR